LIDQFSMFDVYNEDMKRINWLFSLVLVSLSMISCSEKEGEDGNILIIDLKHKVGNNPLAFDSVMYQNEAGNNYNITGLRYYLSNIEFWNGDDIIYQSEEIFHIDAKSAENKIELEEIPLGKYTTMKYLIGIGEEMNVEGALPNEEKHDLMLWPKQMGGGYHFMKMEGYYYDASENQFGYAIHLGTSIGLMEGQMEVNVEIDDSYNDVNISFNVNNLFDDPSYDFVLDGAYTMGVSNLMSSIAKNGEDVLELN